MHSSGELAVSHQFHQKASSLPVRLTPCVARLGNCPLKAVRQGARCAVPQIMKALPGIGRSAVTPYETTARGLPCPDGHNNGVPDAAQYRPATHHVQTTSSIAPVSPPEQKYTQPAQAKPPEKYSPSARKP